MHPLGFEQMAELMSYTSMQATDRNQEVAYNNQDN